MRFKKAKSPKSNRRCPVEFAMIDGAGTAELRMDCPVLEAPAWCCLAGHMVQEEFFGAALDFWLGGPVTNTEKFKK